MLMYALLTDPLDIRSAGLNFALFTVVAALLGFLLFGLNGVVVAIILGPACGLLAQFLFWLGLFGIRLVGDWIARGGK